MSIEKSSRIFRITAIVLLLLTGINALVAGFLFIKDPEGKAMGMTTAYLSESPFSSFLIPGIVLFIVNGLMNLVVAILTLKQCRPYPILVSLQGLLLAGWIIIQVMMVRDFNSLHFIMLTIGIILIITGLLLRKVIARVI